MARRVFCYVSDAIAGITTILSLGLAGIPYKLANPDGELSALYLAQPLICLSPKNIDIKTTSPAGDAAADKISHPVPGCESNKRTRQAC